MTAGVTLTCLAGYGKIWCVGVSDLIVALDISGRWVSSDIVACSAAPLLLSLYYMFNGCLSLDFFL